jgi:transposase
LMGVPAVGPVLASALVATIADPKSFSSGRNLAAWIGLAPRQSSGGEKNDWAASPSKRSLLSTIAGRGRRRCDPLRAAQRRAPAVAGAIAGAAYAEGSPRSRWGTRTREWCGRS